MITYTYNNKQLSVKELAQIAGVTPATMNYRLSVCKTIDEAINFHKFLYQGVYLTIPELAEKAGISVAAIRKRIALYGYDIPAITQPLIKTKSVKKLTDEERKEKRKIWYKTWENKNKNKKIN